MKKVGALKAEQAKRKVEFLSVQEFDFFRF